jgi:hypothetical protein
LSVLYFAGVIPKELYYTLAVKKFKDDVDPSNGFMFRSDCFNLALSQLDDLKE